MYDKDGKCITYKKEVLKPWTEYCSELYNITNKEIYQY